MLNEFSTLENQTMFSTLENTHGYPLRLTTINGSTIAKHVGVI